VLDVGDLSDCEDLPELKERELDDDNESVDSDLSFYCWICLSCRLERSIYLLIKISLLEEVCSVAPCYLLLDIDIAVSVRQRSLS